MGTTTSAATTSARKHPTTPSTNMASNQSYRTSSQQQAFFHSLLQLPPNRNIPSQSTLFFTIWRWTEIQPWPEQLRPSPLSLHVWCWPYHWPFSWTSSTLCYWRHSFIDNQCCTMSPGSREEKVQRDGQWYHHTRHCNKRGRPSYPPHLAEAPPNLGHLSTWWTRPNVSQIPLWRGRTSVPTYLHSKYSTCSQHVSPIPTELCSAWRTLPSKCSMVSHQTQQPMVLWTFLHCSHTASPLPPATWPRLYQSISSPPTYAVNHANNLPANTNLAKQCSPLEM